MICIYKVVNLINGKIYIGRTNNLHRRMIEHRAHASKDGGNFHHDILIYGFENFHFEIIEECEEQDLDNKEIGYIADYREKYGEDMIYNICKGGLGGQTHDISGENNPMFGKEVSLERRKQISEQFKGKKKPPEFGAHLSKVLKGKKKSPEAVAKKSMPVSLININTKQILSFPSKSEAKRQLHISDWVLNKNGTSKEGWRLYSLKV